MTPLTRPHPVGSSERVTKHKYISAAMAPRRGIHHTNYRSWVEFGRAQAPDRRRGRAAARAQPGAQCGGIDRLPASGQPLQEARRDADAELLGELSAVGSGASARHWQVFGDQLIDGSAAGAAQARDKVDGGGQDDGAEQVGQQAVA